MGGGVSLEPGGPGESWTWGGAASCPAEPSGGCRGNGSGFYPGYCQLLAVYMGFPHDSGTIGDTVPPGMARRIPVAEGLLKVHLRPSREGSRPEAPSLPAHLLLCWAVGSGVGGWILQPAGLLGGSGCPSAAPRMAWFLGQPPVLRVLPVPLQILWVQPPGAALGWPLTRSVCVLC